MKEYYRSFIALSSFKNPDRAALLPYIHRQKAEISALHAIRYDFWTTLDYTIDLTMRLLKNPKETVGEPTQTVLRPLFGTINRELNTILQKVTDDEFGYLKHELKVFHHIVTHTINLVDKNVAHFVPRFLFVSLIEDMRLLYPLCERTINPALLARRDYRLLVTRHLAGRSDKRLVGIIDLLLWYREVAPVMVREDRQEYHGKLMALVRSALDQPVEFLGSDAYSLRDMIVELRETVTASLIAERFMAILNELSYVPADMQLDADKWLGDLCAVFIPSPIDERKNNAVLRDLSIADRILSESMVAAEAEDLDTLHRHLFLAGSIRPFVSEVTQPLLSPKVALELDIFFEIMEFFEHQFPDIIMPTELQRAFRRTHRILGEEIERIKVTGSVTISDDDIQLFIDKVNSLRAQNAR